MAFVLKLQTFLVDSHLHLKESPVLKLYEKAGSCVTKANC